MLLSKSKQIRTGAESSCAAMAQADATHVARDCLPPNPPPSLRVITFTLGIIVDSCLEIDFVERIEYRLTVTCCN